MQYGSECNIHIIATKITKFFYQGLCLFTSLVIFDPDAMLGDTFFTQLVKIHLAAQPVRVHSTGPAS